MATRAGTVQTDVSTEAMQALADRDYVIEAYIEASERYARFRLDGKRRDLKAAAQALCEMLQRLAEDSEFFTALAAALENAEGSPIEDIDTFLEDHFQILTKLGLTAAEAERLLDDFRYAVEHVNANADWRDIDQLRRRIGALAQATCGAARSAGPFRRRARKTVHIVRVVLPYAAGLGIVVVDAGGAIFAHHPHPLHSIEHGVRSVFGS